MATVSALRINLQSDTYRAEMDRLCAAMQTLAINEHQADRLVRLLCNNVESLAQFTATKHRPCNGDPVILNYALKPSALLLKLRALAQEGDLLRFIGTIENIEKTRNLERTEA